MGSRGEHEAFPEPTAMRNAGTASKRTSGEEMAQELFVEPLETRLMMSATNPLAGALAQPSDLLDDALSTQPTAWVDNMPAVGTTDGVNVSATGRGASVSSARLPDQEPASLYFCEREDNVASVDFVAGQTQWAQPGGDGTSVTITYSFSNLLDGNLGGGIAANRLTAAIEEALTLWARYAPFNFVRVADAGPAPSDATYPEMDDPDIRVGHHYIDGDSGNNTLAHAYYPPPNAGGLAGDLHFDSSNTWAIGQVAGATDLLETAVHEIGHSLGLNHEPTTDAIMNAMYAGRYTGLGTAYLLPDDIAGIRSIYGVSGTTPPPSGDAYENNDSKAITDGRPEGAANSPNLGLLTTVRTINNLSMDDGADWYRFRTNGAGTAPDFVNINFTHSQGDLDMVVYKADGVTQVGSSTSTGNSERVSLNGQAAGTYYVKVYGYNGAQNPQYTLTIDPPAGVTPPPASDAYESNDTKAITDGRPEGAASSPNLGLLTTVRTINNLSMDDGADWYRFRIGSRGTASDFVKINFSHSQGDVDMVVYKADGVTQVGSGQSTTDGEQVSLNGQDAGTYYVKVYGYRGAQNPQYSLTIDPPPANQGPVIGTWHNGGVTVTAFDVNGGADARVEDIRVVFGAGGSVSSIQLGGNLSYDGVGLTISGATGVGSIMDARTSANGTLAFIAANCQIGNVMLKGGMTGFNLNGKTMGGLTFLADIDGDGDTTDGTAVYSGGGLAMLMVRGSGTVAGDVVTQGRLGMVLALGVTIAGDITSGASIGNVIGLTGGAITGSVRSAGSIGMVMSSGGIGSAGSEIRAATTVGNIMALGGDVRANIVAGSTSNRAVGMVMATQGNISGNIQSAGGVGNVMAIGGTVSGNITATAGPVAMVMAGNGVTGNVRGRTVGMVMAIGGNVSGAVTATGAGARAVGMVMATRGSISGNIQSAGGVGNVMAIGGTVSGNITSAGAIGMVLASNGIGGNLGNAITAGTSIGNIMALGGDIRSSITARGTGARAIGMVMANQGSINESRIRSRGGLGMVMAKDITDTKISAGKLTMVMARRNIARTLLSGGYDFGGDGAVGGSDDRLVSGSVGTVSALNLDRVTVVAGVGPGDTLFGNGNDVRAGGNGKITSVTARGTVTDSVFEAESGTYAI